MSVLYRSKGKKEKNNVWIRLAWDGCFDCSDRLARTRSVSGIAAANALRSQFPALPVTSAESPAETAHRVGMRFSIAPAGGRLSPGHAPPLAK